MIDELNIKFAATADQDVTVFDLTKEWPGLKVTLWALDPGSALIKIDAHSWGSEFTAESAVLEGGKEGVLLGQGGALGLLQLFHGCHAAGEFLLEGEGWHDVL